MAVNFDAFTLKKKERNIHIFTLNGEAVLSEFLLIKFT
jgi:hypothetical protein